SAESVSASMPEYTQTRVRMRRPHARRTRGWWWRERRHRGARVAVGTLVLEKRLVLNVPWECLLGTLLGEKPLRIHKRLTSERFRFGPRRRKVESLTLRSNLATRRGEARRCRLAPRGSLRAGRSIVGPLSPRRT